MKTIVAVFLLVFTALTAVAQLPDIPDDQPVTLDLGLQAIPRARALVREVRLSVTSEGSNWTTQDSVFIEDGIRDRAHLTSLLSQIRLSHFFDPRNLVQINGWLLDEHGNVLFTGSIGFYMDNVGTDAAGNTLWTQPNWPEEIYFWFKSLPIHIEGAEEIEIQYKDWSGWPMTLEFEFDENGIAVIPAWLFEHSGNLIVRFQGGGDPVLFDLQTGDRIEEKTHEFKFSGGFSQIRTASVNGGGFFFGNSQPEYNNTWAYDVRVTQEMLDEGDFSFSSEGFPIVTVSIVSNWGHNPIYYLVATHDDLQPGGSGYTEYRPGKWGRSSFAVRPGVTYTIVPVFAHWLYGVQRGQGEKG